MPPSSAKGGLPELPDFTLLDESLASRAPSSSRTFGFSTSESYESLLQHQVPSPSLCLEEMLGLWDSSPQQLPSSSSAPTKGVNIYPLQDDDRSSVATLLEFGEWVSRQSQNRPPSLLPPPPDILRRGPFVSNTDSVECQLSSTISPDSNRSATPVRLSDSCTRPEEVSIQSPPTSTPPARSITPVPSLTNSQYSSCSSSAGAVESPPSMSISPIDHIGNLPLGRISNEHMAQQNRKFISDDKTKGTNSPFPRLGLDQDDVVVMASPPFVRSGVERHALVRPVAVAESKAAVIQIPQQMSDQNEVSFIDWDDDESGNRWCDSRLARMKKSFNDLRVAERFISDANVRRMVHFARDTQDGFKNVEDTRMHSGASAIQGPIEFQHQDPIARERHNIPDTYYFPIHGFPSGASSKQEELNEHTAVKLRKRPTKTALICHPSPQAMLLNYQNESTPQTSRSDAEGAMVVIANPSPVKRLPSRRKRKRSSTTTSQGQGQKARLGAVGTWVMRVLGREKARSVE